MVDIVPSEGGWSRLDEAYRHIDVFHLNLQEAMQLTKCEHIGDVLDWLSEIKVSLTVVSYGEMGLYAVTHHDQLKMPAFKVEVVDQTGAGDALCAGIIDSLDRYNIDPLNLCKVQLDELAHVLMESQAAGTACVTGIGATSNVRKELMKALIREQGESVLAAVEAVK